MFLRRKCKQNIKVNIIEFQIEIMNSFFRFSGIKKVTEMMNSNLVTRIKEVTRKTEKQMKV